MDMYIPYSVHPEIQKESNIWEDAADIGTILRQLCTYKGVEIVEAKTCIDHVHMCVYAYRPKWLFQFHGVSEGQKQPDDIR